MKYWLCVDPERIAGDKDLEFSGSKQSVNREFNICHGLEPMHENVFVYVIEEMLSSMYYGGHDYLSVGYTPVRPDGVSCVQADMPEIGDGFHVEIVVDDASSERGFRIFSKTDIPYREARRIFWKVLVEYSCPDLDGWEEITAIARYVE